MDRWSAASVVISRRVHFGASGGEFVSISLIEHGGDDVELNGSVMKW